MNIKYNKVVKHYQTIISEIMNDIECYFDDRETSEFCYDNNFKELFPTTILNYIKNTRD